MRRVGRSTISASLLRCGCFTILPGLTGGEAWSEDRYPQVSNTAAPPSAFPSRAVFLSPVDCDPVSGETAGRGGGRGTAKVILQSLGNRLWGMRTSSGEMDQDQNPLGLRVLC